MSQQLISFSEIKSGSLPIPKEFIKEIFSVNKKVVIKESEGGNGITVEAIDQRAVKALLKSIDNLSKR